MARLNPTQRRIIIPLTDFASGVDSFTTVKPTSFEVYWQGSFGDKRTPNYMSNRKPRSLPFNAFHIEGVTRMPSKATCVSISPGRLRSTESIWDQVCHFPLSTGHDIQATERASADLGKQFSSNKSNVTLMFMERKKTADMIAGTALKLVKAVRALKRGRFGDLWETFQMSPTQQQLSNLRSAVNAHPRRFKSDAKMRDFMARSWLEVKYGWQPMLADIYGNAEALAHRAGRDSGLTRIRSRGYRRSEGEIEATCNQRPYDVGAVGQMVRYSTCKLSSVSRLVDEHAVMLAQTGISNPALTAWDAVPLSFVVDWFLPVTSYLESMHTYDGFEFVKIDRVQFTRTVSFVSGTVDLSPYVANYGPTTGQMRINGGMNTYMYTRDSLVRPPSVPLRLTSPISVSHATSAIALFQSMVFSKRR